LSDQSQGEGWWLASDGKWYPPESAPAVSPPPPTPGQTGEPASAVTQDGTLPPTPTSPPFWKRPWVVLIALLVLLLAIAAILGGGDDDGDDQAQTVETTTTAEDVTSTSRQTTTTRPATTTTSAPEFRVGDKVEYADGSSVQVFTWEQPVPPQNDFLGPDPGMEFGVIDVEVCAGDEETPFNTLGLSARTADNRVYTGAFGNARDPDIGSGDIPANGGCRRGYSTLSMPVGQQPVAILWDYGGRQAEWEL
jgi:hypothetical protein